MRNRTTVTSTRLRKVRESRRINLRFMLEYSSVCTVILQSRKVSRFLLLIGLSSVYGFDADGDSGVLWPSEEIS